MRGYTNIFFFVVAAWSLQGLKSENERQPDTRWLDNILKAVLEAMRPALQNLNVTRQDFETGPQELGNFKGHVKDLNIQGLDAFNITVLNISFLTINNLTLVQNFTVRGKYNINGTLAFPLSKSDIHFFGDGDMSADFTNFSVSVKVKCGMVNGTRVVSKFDMYIGLDRMKVQMKNLMGGGDLETVFNDLINDVGLTVFNYYKQPFLDLIKPIIKDLITEIIKPKESTLPVREEL